MKKLILIFLFIPSIVFADRLQNLAFQFIGKPLPYGCAQVASGLYELEKGIYLATQYNLVFGIAVGGVFANMSEAIGGRDNILKHLKLHHWLYQYNTEDDSEIYYKGELQAIVRTPQRNGNLIFWIVQVQRR